jgi:hypothetical protein
MNFPTPPTAFKPRNAKSKNRKKRAKEQWLHKCNPNAMLWIKKAVVKQEANEAEKAVEHIYVFGPAVLQGISISGDNLMDIRPSLYIRCMYVQRLEAI